MNRIKIVASLIPLLLIVSCSKEQPTPEVKPIVQGIRMQTVQSTSVDDYYEAVGTVKARNSSVIASRIMGSVINVHVREGDRVRQGQPLIEIESRDAGIQLQKAQAGVRQARNSLDEVERGINAAEAALSAARANETLAAATLNRYRKLIERRSVSPQEFDEVQAKHDVARAETERADRLLQATKARRNQMLAQIQQAEADVADARVYVSYARINSPMSGIVVGKQIEVGSMAMPGAPLLTIETETNYQLEAAVEETQLGKIQLHDQARVRIEALGNQELTCSVVEIVPTSDPNSRSYIVKLGLPQPSTGQLRSGLYAKAQFISGQRQALTIPQSAVTERGQLVGVFVVDNSGVARLRLIKTGKVFGQTVEVLSGLNAGEQIVVDGLSSIQDGTRVRETGPVASR
jgi:multidrug efflux pump subunit AcrA (membrane-fusion protein)